MNNSFCFQFIQILRERLVLELEQLLGKLFPEHIDREILHVVERVLYGASDIVCSYGMQG